MTDQVLIIGAGHASGQAAATLRQKKFAGKITLIGEEPYYPYQRPPLSKKYLAGELPAERLYFKPASFYDESEIRVILETRVEHIDRAGKFVGTADGSRHDYDKLLIATGARVRKLDVPGANLAGVHYLRNIQDVDAMRSGLRPGANLVVIGAGYIGLEVAAVAAKLGLHVTVVEMADRVMSRVVSAGVSEFYQQEHRAHGVTLMLSSALNGFSGDEQVRQVDLADNVVIKADMVLVGIGVLPNVELASAAGLDVDNGIKVDDRCLSSDPDIFAVGDCTNHPNALLGRRLRLESVHNALEQAKTAAANICGEATNYSQVPWFWSDQYDLKLQIAGISEGFNSTVMRGDPANRSFSCLYLNDGRLIAIDAINSPRDFMQAKALIADRAVVSPDTLANTDIALKDMA